MTLRLFKLELSKSEQKAFQLHIIYSIIEGIILGVLALNEFVFVRSLLGSDYQLGFLFQFSMIVFIFLLFFNEFLNRAKSRKKLLRYAGILTRAPLVVHFTEKIPEDFIAKAAAIRNNDKFCKEGINVNFIEEKDSKLIIRTFERGVEDETLSCGTGTTAAVLCHAFKNGQKEGQTNVVSRGGNLKVSYKTDIQTNTFTDIWLEGPVMRVFEGKTF